MVLFVFVIMFLNLRTFQAEEQTHRRQRWIALVLAVLVLAEFVVVLAGITFTSAKGGLSPEVVTAAGGNSKVFGQALFNNMLLPFEVASVILLVAMVGAIIAFGFMFLAGRTPDPATVAALAAWCAGRGLLLAELHTTGGTLEERFLELIAEPEDEAIPGNGAVESSAGGAAGGAAGAAGAPGITTGGGQA